MLMIALFLAAAAEPEQVRITRNYSAEYNTAVQARPAGDLAKPLLCRAWKVMKKWEGDRDSHPALTRPAEGSAEWERALAWLKDNEQALELLRGAGEKPASGWLMQDALEPMLREAVGGEERAPRENPELPSTLLAYLGPSRESGRLLAVDAAAARRAGDAGRWRRDVRALLGLGEQLLDEPTIIGQLIGRALVATGFTEIKRGIADRRESFDGALWEDLARRVDALRTGRALRLHAEGERWMIQDAIQRAYTDDGAGDGRVNREGWKYIWEYVKDGGGLGIKPPAKGEIDDAAREELMYGMYAGKLVSRKEETELADKLFSHLSAWDGAVIGRADFKAYETLYADVEKSRIRHFALSLFLADLPRHYTGLEWPRQDADGLRLAIAAERFRRAHGKPPETAAELVPTLLDSIPVDRWTGAPVFYTVRDGAFMVYSAGADQDDDHGEPMSASNSFRPDGAWSSKPPAKRPSGDYVIYPEVEP